MTITLNLPPDVERVYLAAATAKGMPLDSLVTEVLITQSQAMAPTAHLEESETNGLIEEDGLVLYKSGRPLPSGYVDEAQYAARGSIEA